MDIADLIGDAGHEVNKADADLAGDFFEEDA